MRIGVLFAMPMEYSPWRARHAFRTRPASPSRGEAAEVYDAEIGRAQVRVAICDVCAPRAAASVAAVCTGLDDTTNRHGPSDALIVAGFAGGLRPAYRAGAIVVPRHVHHAPHTPHTLDAVPCDARLVARAAECGAIVVDSLVTIDHVAFTVEEKTRLGLMHDVVDMETARLLVEARVLGVPAVAIRVVGDPLDEPVPFELELAMGPDNRVRPGRFAFEAARRPWRWPTLARAFHTHDRARHQLAAFLDRFVSAWTATQPPRS